MNVRWMAVIIGFIVDYIASFVVFLLAAPFLASPTYNINPNLANPGDVALLCLGVLMTAIGGYIAGRVAQVDRALNGFLVGVIGILFNQLMVMGGGPPLPRVYVVATAIACGAAALGGFLSRFPPQKRL